jgi:chorismate dehydratase
MIRISAVRYSNSYPLIYGLRESGINSEITIEIDHPSECARKLADNSVDIGLIPVAVLPELDKAEIISDFCIGTNAPVRTVMLLSNDPIDKISKINLDYRSRSSVALTRVLAAKFWNQTFEWQLTDSSFNFEKIEKGEGVVIIGDQCFELEGKYRYSIDLAVEWKKHTGLPFVFAVWAANKNIDPEFLMRFNRALEFGINNIGKAVESFGQMSSMPFDTLVSYLYNNIDYRLDDSKKMAMETFISYLSDIKQR